MFVLVDQKGKILINKNDLNVFGEDILESLNPQVRLASTPFHSWISADNSSIQNRNLLPKNLALNTLVEIYATPINLSNIGQVGSIIIGRAVDNNNVHTLEKTTRSFISFIGGDGKSYSTPQSRKTTLKDLDVRSTLIARESIKKFSSNKNIYLGKFIPMLDSNEKIVFHSFIFQSLTEELEYFKSIKHFIFLIGALAILFGLGLALVIGRGVSSAIGVLIEAVTEIGNGNLDFETKVNSKDEFSLLGTAINNMAKGLREKKAITKIFKTYVGKSTGENILDKMDSVKLGGEKREVVVFFSDIADYTSLSENFSAEELVRFINTYLSQMGNCIEREEGVIDKFI